MKVTGLILTAVAMILLVPRAQAMPPAFAMVPDLVAAAEVIVVGRIVPLEAHMGSNPPDEILTLTPDRVLKGTLPGGSNAITVQISIGERSARIESYGVFFLRPAGNGVFTPAIAEVSSVVAVPRTASVVPGTDPVLAVAEELAAVLGTPADILTETREKPDTFTPTMHAQVLYSHARSAASTIPIAVSRAPLEAALQSNPDLLSRCWIIGTLIAMGVPASIDSIKPYLDAPAVPGTEMTQSSVIRSLYRSLLSG